MIDTTLADLRNSSEFFDTQEILHVFDGRKKEDIGYFVPKYLKKDFEEFVQKIEKKNRNKLLKRVAQVQKKDPINDGAINDGLR